MLMLLFSYKLGWLPSSLATSFDYDQMSWLGKIGDRLAHLALPALALGVGGAAGVARYTRGSLLEVIRQDYIRTARSKGLSEETVIFKHALRNGLITVVTLFGLYLPFLFSGAVLIETIFAWPGMGRVIVSAIFQRDYPLIMANTFIFAASVVIGNLVADIAYCVVDPRIRYD
jgi:peptide/nickel transport system permease protein